MADHEPTLSTDLRHLLDDIVRYRQSPRERTANEITTRAPAALPGVDASEADLAAARELAGSFEAGLRAAWRSEQAGGGALSLDDRDPVENAIADALVRYLVRPGLATVASDDLGGQHFRYRVQVDWDALDRLARRSGVDLAGALARAPEPPVTR